VYLSADSLFMGAVSKTVNGRKLVRGFESLPLRLNTDNPRWGLNVRGKPAGLANDDTFRLVQTRSGGNFCNSFCNGGQG